MVRDGKLIPGVLPGANSPGSPEAALCCLDGALPGAADRRGGFVL